MIRIDFPTARDGSLTALVGTRSLHSRFNPAREAERFIAERIDPDAPPTTILLIGSGLGYAIAALRRRAPRSRVVSFALHDELARRALVRADAGWSPGDGRSIHAFLDEFVSDLDTAGLSLIEWSPVVDCFAETASVVREAIAAHLRRAGASLATQGGFGRRWLRNRLRNYLIARPARPVPGNRAVSCVAIVAAGPSLERSLQHIAALRERVALWVTGSALEAVSRAGLRPDLVLVTDAGVHAAEHVRAVAVGTAGTASAVGTAGAASVEGFASGTAGIAAHGTPLVVAAPLSAASGAFGGPLQLVLNEGDALDGRLPGVREAHRVPPHGTVTASAAALARMLSDLPIVLLGADFAWYESRSHVRPHLAHAYRGFQSGRLHSQTSMIYAAQLGTASCGGCWRTNESLRAYAEWFTTFGFTRFAPAYALEPSPMLEGVPILSTEELRALPARSPDVAWEPAPEPWPDKQRRAAALREVLTPLVQSAGACPQPESPRDLESRHPDVAELAIRLALPELLRWAASPRDERASRWGATRDRIVDELRDASEIPA